MSRPWYERSLFEDKPGRLWCDTRVWFIELEFKHRLRAGGSVTDLLPHESGHECRLPFPVIVDDFEVDLAESPWNFVNAEGMVLYLINVEMADVCRHGWDIELPPPFLVKGTEGSDPSSVISFSAHFWRSVAYLIPECCM